MYMDARTYVILITVFAAAIAAVYLMISWTAWKYRRFPAAIPLMILMLAAGEYSIAYILQLASHSFGAALTWYNIGLPGASILGPGWLVFGLLYTRQNKNIRFRSLALLAIIPIICCLAAWTNPWHGLYAAYDFYITATRSILEMDFKLFYWINFAYAYATTSVGMFFLIRMAWRRLSTYKLQVLFLIAGTLIPIWMNVMYVKGFALIPHMDIAPFAFLITGISWSLAIFRFQLLDLVPVARERVLESMPIGMLTFDAHNRLVDINAIAKQMINQPASNLIGKSVPQYQAFITQDGQAKPYQEIEIDGQYQGILIVPLYSDLHEHAGTLLLVQDISRRKLAELAEGEQRRLVEILRETAADFNHALQLEEVLDLMMKHLAQLVQCDGINIILLEIPERFEVSRRRCTSQHPCNFPPSDDDEPNCPLKLVQQKGPPYQPLFHSRAEHPASYQNCSGRERVNAWLTVPILSRQKLDGFILLDWLSTSLPAQPAIIIERINTYLNQASVAIERAQLYAEAQRSNRHLQTLSDITFTALESKTLENMLQTLADRLGEMFDADGAFITFWDDANQATIPKAAYGSQRESYSQDLPTIGRPTLTATVLRTGHVMVVEDVFNTPYIDPQIAIMYDSRSLLGIPLIASGVKLGAALVSYEHPHRFTQNEINLGEQAGRLIALAIDKVRLLEAEHQQRVQSEAFRDELQNISITDELTGLLNRRGLFTKAQVILDWAQNTNRAFGVMIFDLDNFKVFNDTLGHATGDQILRQIADLCRANVRDQDLIGRYGGDEFVIIFPGNNLEETVLVVERLRAAIFREMAAFSAGIEQKITISGGVTAFDGRNHTLDELLSTADMALYQAKSQGKNCVVARLPK